jgi:hypothetical protein
VKTSAYVIAATLGGRIGLILFILLILPCVWCIRMIGDCYYFCKNMGVRARAFTTSVSMQRVICEAQADNNHEYNLALTYDLALTLFDYATNNIKNLFRTR